ncbi:unnamed protein product [Ectocarpus sp. CCAP 1310/34]|nr:unnamed protein product [Ectocarpus sp. CCAP 1310/34]
MIWKGTPDRTFTATQFIATVLCSFTTLLLAVPAGSRRFARRMGIVMKVLLACSVFFQLVAACLAASVYVHLKIHIPYHDGRTSVRVASPTPTAYTGSGFPAMLLGPTFALAWGSTLIALVEISLLRISHPESRGTGPHQEPPFHLRNIYNRNHPKSRFWVLFGIGSLIVAFDVTTLVNYVDASGLTSECGIVRGSAKTGQVLPGCHTRWKATLSMATVAGDSLASLVYKAVEADAIINAYHVASGHGYGGVNVTCNP